MPPPPVASSSRPREDRSDRQGKLPARVLNPPLEEVAALKLRDAAEVDGPHEVEDTGRQLDGVPLEVQEAWICEDLIFVLQVRLFFRYCKTLEPALTETGRRRRADTLRRGLRSTRRGPKASRREVESRPLVR